MKNSNSMAAITGKNFRQTIRKAIYKFKIAGSP